MLWYRRISYEKDAVINAVKSIIVGELGDELVNVNGFVIRRLSCEDGMAVFFSSGLDSSLFSRINRALFRRIKILSNFKCGVDRDEK